MSLIRTANYELNLSDWCFFAVILTHEGLEAEDGVMTVNGLCHQMLHPEESVRASAVRTAGKMLKSASVCFIILNQRVGQPSLFLLYFPVFIKHEISKDLYF
jgi:hypothetical protein